MTAKQSNEYTISHQLKVMRLKLAVMGVSQKQLAKILGTSTRAIRERERGECRARMESLLALAYVAQVIEEKKRVKAELSAVRYFKENRPLPHIPQN